MDKKSRIILIMIVGIIGLVIIKISFGTNTFYRKNKIKTSTNLFPMVLPNNKWTYMDSNGDVAIKAKFDSANPFSEGLAAVQVKGKYGYIDNNGKFIIKPQFEDGLEFKCGRAAVRKGTRYGFIDKRGRMVIKPQYGWVRNFSDGLAYVVLWKKHLGEQKMFIDRYGKVKISTTGKNYKFDSIGADFSQGLIPVKFGYMYGYINKKEQVVIKPEYQGAQGFSDGLAAVKIMGKWGFINKNGKVVIKPEYDIAGDFSDGIAIAFLNNNDYEDKLCEFKYRLNLDFGMDIFKVNSMKFINKRGITMFEKNAIGLEYFHIPYIKFSDGLCCLDFALEDGHNSTSDEAKENKKKLEYVDKKGKVIFERKYIYADR